MKESHRNLIKSALRWALALGLIVWLFKSGKLSSLSDLERLFKSPGLFAVAFVGVAMNYVFNFFRWKTLLSGVGVELPYRQVTRLSMIGQFFSIFMPGSVGGDIIKAVYIAKSHPQHRTLGVASIVLDRALGFLTLLSFASFFFLLSFDARHIPKSLQGFGSMLALGTLALFLFVLAPGQVQKILARSQIQNRFVERLSKTLKAFARNPSTLIKALGFSFLSQGASIVGMYMIGEIIYGPLPWGNLDILRFVSAVAVGTTATALPLSPMGLGVGQIAFGKVFVLLGAPDEAHGIVIVSATQIICFVLNLSGALWFLKSKKELEQVVA